MIVFLMWIVIVIFSTAIGEGKKRPVLGFFLGFFLSLVGLIIIAVLEPKK